jgi:hypothetical protein
MQRASKVSLIAIAVTASGGAVALLTPFVGCMGEGTTCPPLVVLVDAGPDAHEAGPGPTGVRLANLSPTAPSIDFCLAPQGTGVFTGPILAAYASMLNSQGIAPGASNLGYQQVSAYISVKPDTYMVRIVAVPDCSVGLLQADVPVTTLANGGFATVALLGEALPKSLQGIALADDPTQPVGEAGAKLYLRFLHAAPNQGDIEVSLNNKPDFDLPFGQTSSADAATPDASLKVDKNGYLVTSGATNGASVGFAPVQAGDGGAPALAQGTFYAAAGAVLTLAVVGDSPQTDGGTAPFGILECVDNAATVGVLGQCAVLDGGH